MQLLMSFVEMPPSAGNAPVWTTLDDKQRAEVVATLARLIAKVATAPNRARAVEREEKADD